MPRPSRERALSVWMNGERVGLWVVGASGPQELIYADEWLQSPRVRPLSLSMPLGPAGTTYKGAVVEHFFENLLPDSREIRERIRQRFAANTTRAFDLLAQLGRDCVGAVQLLKEDETPTDVHSIHGEMLTAAGIEALLRGVLSPTPLGSTEPHDEFRISLAGAQEKTALLRRAGRWMLPTGSTPTTHIFKLPIGETPQGIDLKTSVENEWLSTRILREYAVPAAASTIEQFGEQKVLVVERFDRRLSADRSWIVRVPQEDFCQVTAMPRERKYEADGGPGIRKIMDLLLGSERAEADRIDFFRTQVLFWMLCAIDGHAKNFSVFLEAEGRFRLTPRKDVLSAYPVLGKRAKQLPAHKVKMAMAVDGENRHYHWSTILRRHWDEMARRCGIAAFWPRIVTELIEITPTVIDAVASELPKGFPQALADSIFSGLRKSAAKMSV